MDRKLGGLILAAALAGSANAKGPDFEIVKSALEAYADCTVAAVERYAASDASATEVVAAAEGACASEFEAFRRVNREHLVAIMYDDRRAVAEADRMAEDRRASIRSRLAALVLELRMPPEPDDE